MSKFDDLLTERDRLKSALEGATTIGAALVERCAVLEKRVAELEAENETLCNVIGDYADACAATESERAFTSGECR